MRKVADAHWRDSARRVRFFMFDGVTAYPLVLCLMWPRMWTLILSVIGVLFFALLLRFGYTPAVFFRVLRSFFAGRHILAIPWWMK